MGTRLASHESVRRLLNLGAVYTEIRILLRTDTIDYSTMPCRREHFAKYPLLFIWTSVYPHLPMLIMWVKHLTAHR